MLNIGMKMFRVFLMQIFDEKYSLQGGVVGAVIGSSHFGGGSGTRPTGFRYHDCRLSEIGNS